MSVPRRPARYSTIDPNPVKGILDQSNLLYLLTPHPAAKFHVSPGTVETGHVHAHVDWPPGPNVTRYWKLRQSQPFVTAARVSDGSASLPCTSYRPQRLGSEGSTFEALLRQMTQPGSRTGNAGLTSPEQIITAAPGFRPLKIARMDRESSSVVSLMLEPVDGRPLAVPLPGQFVVLRLRPEAEAPPESRRLGAS
jgi:hypothetical protein